MATFIPILFQPCTFERLNSYNKQGQGINCGQRKLFSDFKKGFQQNQSLCLVILTILLCICFKGTIAFLIM